MELMGVEERLASKGNQTINPATKDKPMHYLSLVKPQMIQQVLSRRLFCDERKAESIPSHSDMEGSGEGELMKLFPQHPGFDTTKTLSTGSCLILPSHHHLTGKSAKQLQGFTLLNPSGVGGVQPAASRSVPPATTPQKKYSAQLTILYDGTVNVFDLPADRAQAIINMLDGNWNAHQFDADPNFDEGISCRTTSSSSNRALIRKAAPISVQNEVPIALPTPKETAAAQRIKEIENLHRELPMARRQSLQRFIEKRQIRLNSVNPYTRTETSVRRR